MELLLSHWHCILPLVGIAVAIFFMRDKNRNTPDYTTQNITADLSKHKE